MTFLKLTIKLTPGVWYWKDDTNTLEFASSNTATEENLKNGKNIHFQEIHVKTLKSIFQDDCSATLPEKRLADREEKLYMLSKWEPHEYVTLDDVKYAALLLNQANKSHLMPSFAAVMRNEKLDEFLMALLLYLSFYLGKTAMEKKCRSLTSRKTSWKKDRTFFEGFYNFSSYVAWLVFRRKHFQLIREEIGRLLFSDMFNPALKDRDDVDSQKAGDQSTAENTEQLPSPRKVGAKHHSISSMINEHSPMLRTVLPLPKDGAQHLFQKHDSWDKDPQPDTYDGPSDFSELFNTKVGIIGAHGSELKSLMSKPVGMTEEDEEEEEKEQEQERKDSDVSNLTGGVSLLSLRNPRNRLHSRSTVVSRLMAEADCNQSN